MSKPTQKESVKGVFGSMFRGAIELRSAPRFQLILLPTTSAHKKKTRLSSTSRARRRWSRIKLQRHESNIDDAKSSPSNMNRTPLPMQHEQPKQRHGHQSGGQAAANHPPNGLPKPQIALVPSSCGRKSYELISGQPLAGRKGQEAGEWVGGWGWVTGG